MLACTSLKILLGDLCPKVIRWAERFKNCKNGRKAALPLTYGKKRNMLACINLNGLLEDLCPIPRGAFQILKSLCPSTDLQCPPTLKLFSKFSVHLTCNLLF